MKGARNDRPLLLPCMGFEPTTSSSAVLRLTADHHSLVLNGTELFKRDCKLSFNTSDMQQINCVLDTVEHHRHQVLSRVSIILK